MKKVSIYLIFIFLLLGHVAGLYADNLSSKINKLEKKNYCKKTSFFEIESLFSMFFFGGYHFAIGYRFGQFRLRTSVIYSGSYDVENSGVDNNSDNFSRYYNHGSFGVFFGYFPFKSNILKGLHTYLYLESHNWKIKNKSNNATGSLHTYDFGFGIAYQLFVWKGIYIEPGYHIYFRKNESLIIGGDKYTLPSTDHSIIFRLGIRL